MVQQTLQCPFCSRTSTRGTGLASHIRGAHPKQYASWSGKRKTATKTGAKTAAKTVGKRGRPAKTAPVAMNGGMSDIITRLEQQRLAIESALEVLHRIAGE